MARDRSETFRKVYELLSSCEKHDKTFTVDDLARAAGWKESSARTNLAKKLAGVRQYKEEEFARLMSQKQAVSADPKKPQLQPKVEGLVRKARESALLALQIYNNPTTVFKTEAYSVLMVIAWTALFHGIFERRGVKSSTSRMTGHQSSMREYLAVPLQTGALRTDNQLRALRQLQLPTGVPAPARASCPLPG